VETVAAQCGKQQSQNQQCPPRKRSLRWPICASVSQYPAQRETDPKKEVESHSKKHDPYLASSCSNQSQGALASDNSHTEYEEDESDLLHERGDLHCQTRSDPYHQEE
jgi:hypothetical protein